MVREPKIRDAAQILREQLTLLGFDLANQKSLDIAAKMKGYAGYQMYSQLNPEEKGSKASKSLAAGMSSKQESSDSAELRGFGVEKTARELAEVFGLHGEWSRYCREDWQYEVANRDTHLGYWDWCVHQAESDGDIMLYLKEAYLVDLGDLTRYHAKQQHGWAWLTDSNVNFEGSGPIPPVYQGPFPDFEKARAALKESHPLTKQVFIGNPANLPLIREPLSRK